MHGDALDDAGIVYQDVYLTHFLVDGVNQLADSHLVGHVADIALHVGDASLLVVVKSALQGSLVDVVKHDVLHTSLYKGLCNVETNAVRCACNPRILTFEREIR